MFFDHIAISAETLAQASAHAEAALGVALQPGGQHARFHTHNRLLGLQEGLYLEALSMMPEAPVQDQPRMFGIDQFKGPARLTNWICRCTDLEATLAALPPGFGTPVEVTRGALSWRMAVPKAGFLPFDNCAPALIQWLGDLHPVDMLETAPCRLQHLTVSHPQAEELQALLAPLMADERLRFVSGAAGLQAGFDTPQGARVLT